MQINKFKKVGKNKYKIEFDNIELVVYEDIIFKYDLLLKKEIDIKTLDEIIDDNKYFEAYNLSLGYIDIKMRNKKEIESYLKKKEFNDEYISFAIDKLNKLGLLNDKKYIEAFINDKILLSNDGPYKIKRSLLENDLDEEYIDNYLNTISDKIWIDKLSRIVDKKQKTLGNKSYYVFINKMKNDLYNLGYDKNLIEDALLSVKYDNSSINKEFNKAKKKYIEKTKIVNYLLRKGYSYEEINNCFIEDN